MNSLTHQNNSTNPVTMTSLEIVDFINDFRAKNESNPVQLRHDHFMAKVPKVLGEKVAPKFLGTSSYQGNGSAVLERSIYIFPKREACLMAMSYSYELQAQVFDRMTAMEEALKKPVITLPNFTDPAEAAMAWAEQYKAKQLAEQQVAVLAPKAQALDTIANTDGTYTIRECAKTIGIGERKLVQLLIDKKWVFRENDGRLQPYAEKRNAGIFINRPSPVITNKNTGEEKVHLHMRITALGLTRITGLVNKCVGVAA